MVAAFVLLAGCAATTVDPHPRITGFEQERTNIAEREKRCIDEATRRGRDDNERTTESQTQKDTQRQREISECHAAADMENAHISEQERDEYQRQAQEERERASLMMILTTTRPH